MFDGLTNKLSGIFAKLGSRGILKEQDIEEGLREIRLALLEADVSLPVVKDFMAKVKEKALGEKGIETVSAEVTMVPDTTVKLEGKDAEKMMALVDALEEHDDVQNIYANYEIEE